MLCITVVSSLTTSLFLSILFVLDLAVHILSTESNVLFKLRNISIELQSACSPKKYLTAFLSLPSGGIGCPEELSIRFGS